MEDICPLCKLKLEKNDPTRRSLRHLIEVRRCKIPFKGPGPEVHKPCFDAGTGVRELIESIVAAEAQPTPERIPNTKHEGWQAVANVRLAT